MSTVYMYKIETWGKISFHVIQVSHVNLKSKPWQLIGTDTTYILNCCHDYHRILEQHWSHTFYRLYLKLNYLIILSLIFVIYLYTRWSHNQVLKHSPRWYYIIVIKLILAHCQHSRRGNNSKKSKPSSSI